MSEHSFRDSQSTRGILWSQKDDGRQPKARTIVVAVVGVVGAGKTTFINTVIGGVRVPEHSLVPSKPEIQPHHVTFGSLEVIFLDVPGFDNPQKPDILILKDFLDFIQEGTSENIKLSGIIYLHRISDVRIGGSALKAVKLLKGLCGEAFLPRLTLVTTMWDLIRSKDGEKDGNRRENELRENFWKDLLDHKAVYTRYDGTLDGHWGAQQVIKRYLDDPFPYMTARIQDQARWPLGKTDAGRVELESIQLAQEQQVMGYEDLQRIREELLRSEVEYSDSEMKYSALQEELASIENELQEKRRRIEDRRALLARYADPAATLHPHEAGEGTGFSVSRAHTPVSLPTTAPAEWREDETTMGVSPIRARDDFEVENLRYVADTAAVYNQERTRPRSSMAGPVDQSYRHSFTGHTNPQGPQFDHIADFSPGGHIPPSLYQLGQSDEAAGEASTHWDQFLGKPKEENELEESENRRQGEKAKEKRRRER